MLGVIAQPRIPAVLLTVLCQEVSKKMATCIDKLASGVPFIDRQSMRSAALKITWYPLVTYWSAVSEEEGLRWPVGPLRQAFL